MTSMEMNAMLKSIRVKRKGGGLLISGRAIVDGESTGFMVLRKIPPKKPPKIPPIKLLWFEELGNFNMKGENK